MNLRSYLRGAGLGILITAVILIFGGGNRTKAMTDAEVMARAKELGMSSENETLTEAYTVATAPEPVAGETAASEPAGAGETTAPEPAAAAEDTTAQESAAAEDTTAQESTAEEDTTVQESAAGEDTTAQESAAAEDTTVSESAAKNTAGEEAGVKTAEDIIEESIQDKQTTELKSDVTGEDKTKSELLADAAETEAESRPSVTETATGFISVHVNAGSSSTAVAKELEKAGAVSSASAFDGFLCANGYDRRLSTGDFRIPAGASDEEIARILMRR